MNTNQSDSPALPSERKFGCLFGSVCFLLAIFYKYKDASFLLVISLATLGCLFFAIALAKPKLLSRLNRAWFQLGLILGKIASPLVIGLIFFGIITPVAVITRLFGRDALKLRKQTGVKSYWVERNPPGPEPASFKRQF